MRQGLDHAQVELGTKIRSKYIRALEDEQFTILPSETYVKGFLRAYAEFLGLDGQLYVDEYASRYTVGEYDDAPRKVSVPRRRDHALQRRAVVLALAGITAATGLVVAAWKFGGNDTTAGTPAVLKPSAAPSELQLVGRGKGSYVEVRRNSSQGVVVLQATVAGGRTERVVGDRFWLSITSPTGVRVSLGGKPVALPPRRNLHVLVTPTSTSLAGR